MLILNEFGKKEMKIYDDAGLPYPKYASDKWYDKVDESDSIETKAEYTYWEIRYISCEGNNRWTVARTSSDWTEDDVRSSIPMGGYDDAPATILDVFETSNTDYRYDFDNGDLYKL